MLHKSHTKGRKCDTLLVVRESLTGTRKQGHMTRKDFQLIASIIRAEKESGGDGGTLAMVAERFSQQLGNLNPNFKPDTFFTACGMPNGEWVI